MRQTRKNLVREGRSGGHEPVVKGKKEHDGDGGDLSFTSKVELLSHTRLNVARAPFSRGKDSSKKKEKE